MQLNNQQHDAYLRAAALCSKYEKSSTGIYQKLLNWGLNQEETVPVLEKLTAEKFIDDERYSRSYVRDKFRFNKWGKVKITYHLRMEKIPGAIIESALEEIEENNYRETLAGLIKEKNKNLQAANPYDRKAKLFRFAQSRGFEAGLIYPVIDEVIAREVKNTAEE